MATLREDFIYLSGYTVRGVFRMPKPLSNYLRKRIIEAKLRGNTEDKIAAEIKVNKSTVTKLWALYRETGSYEARPNPNGRKPALSMEQLEQIAQKICEQPDITLQELIDGLNLAVRASTLHRAVNDKLGYRFKKLRVHANKTRRWFAKDGYSIQ
jgi:transposase